MFGRGVVDDRRDSPAPSSGSTRCGQSGLGSVNGHISCSHLAPSGSLQQRRAPALHPPRVMPSAVDSARFETSATSAKAFAGSRAMYWLLSVLVVIPALMLFAALTLTFGARRSLSSMPQAFPCKIGIAPRGAAARNNRWPRRVSYATWVDNALVVADGLLRARVRMVNVRVAQGMVDQPAMGRPSGLGARPVYLSLQLDDGVQVVVAAPHGAESLVAGPYLAALLSTGVGEAAGHQGS